MLVNDALSKRRIRSKVANMVKRNNINKKCFNCNKDGRILYDFNDPYKVVFICSECRKDSSIVKESNSHRIDINELIGSKLNNVGDVNLINKHIKWLSDDNIVSIIDNYLKSELTLGKYCDVLNISRYQFNSIVKRYKEYTGDKDIEDKIKKKMHLVQKNLVIKIKSEKKKN